MAVRTIRIYGDACLKKVAKPVEDFDDGLRDLVRDLAETMYASRGIGLAAPQVGQSVRLFVIDVDWVEQEEEKKPRRNLQVFVNPEITWESDEDDSSIEGCLSVPDIEGEVFRSIAVKVRYTDEKGRTRQRRIEALEACCVQHELDHLDGLLFIDRMPFLKRQKLAGKLSALKKKNAVSVK